jgi:hypothetical protein
MTAFALSANAGLVIWDCKKLTSFRHRCVVYGAPHSAVYAGELTNGSFPSTTCARISPDRRFLSFLADMITQRGKHSLLGAGRQGGPTQTRAAPSVPFFVDGFYDRLGFIVRPVRELPVSVRKQLG